MLTDTPLLRSMGARTLFLLTGAGTAAILLWMHQMRLSGDLHGLATSFFVLFAYEDYGATVVQLLILIAAVFLSASRPGRRAVRVAGEHPWPLAGIAFVALSAGALLVYHNHPLSMDEYAVYFQSQVFAAGHLSGHFPPATMDWLIPPGFQNYFLNTSHVTGQVAASYWPGFSLLLTPFTFAGIPWACNPTLTALTLVVIHRLALHIFEDREAAGLALLLSAASPVVFGLGISYYTMPAHLLANSLYALLLIKVTPRRALISGVVGSIALVLHNPVPHILFCIPWIWWLASRQDRWPLLAALFLGYLPLCLLLGVGWFLFSQNLMHAGASDAAALSGSAANMAGVFTAPGATIVLARVIGMTKTWIWAVPTLLILAVAGAASARNNPYCRLLASSALLTLVGYFFVPVDQGHGWGYRYFHSAWLALPLLATAALYRPALRPTIPDATRAGASGMFADADTRAYLVTCTVLTLVFGLGFRAWEMQSFMARDLDQLPHYLGTERQVVIPDLTLSFYGADLVQNDPWLRGNVIRLYSHGREQDRQMMAQYYPALHLVYADHHGWVWSEKPHVDSPR